MPTSSDKAKLPTPSATICNASRLARRHFTPSHALTLALLTSLALSGCAPAEADDAETLTEAVGEATTGAGAVDNGYYRTLIPNLGDPDVLVLGDMWIVTGTDEAQERQIPFYRGTPKAGFEHFLTYDPSAEDPRYDYCGVSTPDISQFDGLYHLLFSARRMRKGEPCPNNRERPTTYYANAPEGTTDLGPPTTLDFGEGAPRSRNGASCEGVSDTLCMRGDASLYVEGNKRWLSYVYRDEGIGNIASIELSNPSKVVLTHRHHRTEKWRQNVAGPEMFKANGRYYMLFNEGHIDGEAYINYLVTDRPENLRWEHRGSWNNGSEHGLFAKRLTWPAVRESDGHIVRSHGSGSVVAWKGGHYLLNQVVESAGIGERVRRDTAIAKLSFEEDGDLVSTTSLTLTWRRWVTDRFFSLDIITNGERIGPCSGLKFVGKGGKFRYDGICRSSGDYVPVQDVETFIICSSRSSSWQTSGACARRSNNEAELGELWIDMPAP